MEGSKEKEGKHGMEQNEGSREREVGDNRERPSGRVPPEALCIPSLTQLSRHP